MFGRIVLLNTLIFILGFFFVISPEIVGKAEVAVGDMKQPTETGQVEAHPWEGSQAQKAFSEFSHHIGGFFVVLMAGLSFLEAAGRLRHRWVKSLWPIFLLILGMYMIVFSDRYAWPIAPKGFWESLSDPEVIQHKAFAVIMLVLGLVELLRVQQVLSSLAWIVLLYLIMILPGVLLLAHSPVMSIHHHSHQSYGQHLIMGALALLAVGSRLLYESGLWRWKYAAFAWPSFVLVLGIQLLLYSE